ncbi:MULTISPECIES: hypothetical protein [Microbacterium]|uniref:hypothetical protein n=1 Tax=Microbacterium TaxID=33882 RepID=UPI00344C54FD
MDEAEENIAVEVKIHLEATVKVWSETALFFMAAAATMDPRISGASLETRLEEMSDGRWTPLLELISAERLVDGLPGVEYTGSVSWIEGPAWDAE